MSTIEKALAKQKQAQQANTRTQIENAERTADKSVLETEIDVSPETTPRNQTEDMATVDKETIYIDNDKLTERGFLHSGGDAHHQQEEFRHIKRKLINNAFGIASKTLKQSNLIMVSSANPNEGKTFVSINLALSIALEQDKTVLLIDADVLRPSLHRELEFENTSGLLDYLCGNLDDLSDIIYSSNLPNLKIMPAGKAHHLTNELLASQRMATLANELSARYPDRVVIFDCPPLLGVTETPVLASLMGQAVVVIEESRTRIEDIKRATSQLSDELATGFVLNKTIKSNKDIYGYYGYGYGKKR